MKSILFLWTSLLSINASPFDGNDYRTKNEIQKRNYNGYESNTFNNIVNKLHKKDYIGIVNMHSLIAKRADAPKPKPVQGKIENSANDAKNKKLRSIDEPGTVCIKKNPDTSCWEVITKCDKNKINKRLEPAKAASKINAGQKEAGKSFRNVDDNSEVVCMKINPVTSCWDVKYSW
ncbi:hypothetical protein BB561_006864 [Smittium simulii]|uniref:Uncharacterized protein n=1 Tax=Smittium simulii TaxID=133385 RepID=A0A2T9Y0R3_9FUNG|nr:hypothetical protein BB561_006864 [Smittium simulii]